VPGTAADERPEIAGAKLGQPLGKKRGGCRGSTYIPFIYLFIYIYIIYMEPLKYGVCNIVNRGWDEKKSS